MAAHQPFARVRRQVAAVLVLGLAIALGREGTVRGQVEGKDAAERSAISAKTEYFVSPAGRDNNPGTFALPFATLAKASKAVKPGDTITIRAGTYRYLASSQYDLHPSGRLGSPITIRAYPGERVVIDLSEQPAKGSWQPVSDYGGCWRIDLQTATPLDSSADYTQFRAYQQSPTLLKDESVIRAERAAGYPVPYLVNTVNGDDTAWIAGGGPRDAFTNPGKYPPLCDSKGNLQFDLNYSDGRYVYFKPRSDTFITSPDTQLRIISPSSQFCICPASSALKGPPAFGYVTVEGLTIEYGWAAAQIVGYAPDTNVAQGVVLRGNTFRYHIQGILLIAGNSTVESNICDMIGMNNGLKKQVGVNQFVPMNCINHCLYPKDGPGLLVRNNFFSRSYGGYGAQICYGDDGVKLLGNVTYGCQGGVLISNRGVVVANHIHLSRAASFAGLTLQGYDGVKFYDSCVQPTVANCYLEGQLTLRCSDDRLLQDPVIRRNVINNTSSNPDLAAVWFLGTQLSLKNALVDENWWLGRPHWVVRSCPITGGGTLALDASSFDAWQTALRACPEAATWERSSHYVPATFSFPFDDFEKTLLNVSSPQIATIMAYCRNYCKTKLAELAGGSHLEDMKKTSAFNDKPRLSR